MWGSRIYSLNFTPALEQAKSSIGQIKQKGHWQECVCLSLSNESLVTTIGELLSLVWFHGENRSPFGDALFGPMWRQPDSGLGFC